MRLVARGLSNAEIAAELVLGERAQGAGQGGPADGRISGQSNPTVRVFRVEAAF
ncbi:MAG: hypothetical protein H0W55_08805 [Actinobacteria bacterium]|nr:hypothetical protein [Actinomycetota bacterium]MDQ3532842.1 hypothetical protein [Actinomycetota bacterium]